MSPTLFPLLFTFLSLRELTALTYDDLVTLGFDGCPASSSCGQMPSPPPMSQFANCRCDRNCGKAGDCCIDARVQPGVTQLRSAVCADPGYYMTGTCPSTYTEDTKTVQMCENDDLSDPMLSAPVTDMSTNKTYLNRYCAQCRDASIDQLNTWIIHILCYHAKSQPNFNQMVYNRDLKSWGMQNSTDFYPCDIKFGKPTTVNRLRACVPDLISTCPTSYRRQTYRRHCESYTLAVRAGDKNYRNPHCAVCHGFTSNQIDCLSADLGSRHKTFSLAMIVDVNRSDGDIVGVSVPGNCPAGQKFDMFYNKCRRRVCALPGYVRRGNKCVKV